MKRAFIALIALLISSFALCAEWSASYSIEFKKSVQYEAVVAAKIGQIEDVFGKKGLNLDVWALAGIDQTSEKGSLGAAISYPFLVAKDSYIDFGAKAKAYDGKGPEIGIFFSFRIALK